MITGIYAANNLITTQSGNSLNAYINGVSNPTLNYNLTAYITSASSTTTQKSTSLFGQGSTFLFNYNQSPDLRAYISVLPSLSVNTSDMQAYINSNFSGQTQGINYIYGQGSTFLFNQYILPDLKASIDGISKKDINNLNGYIVPLTSQSSILNGFIRPTVSSFIDLYGDITGLTQIPLNGFYRALQSGINNLLGSVVALPPIVLSGTYQAFQFETLSGYINPVPGEDLNALISGLSYLNLNADITGVNTLNLSGSIDGIFEANLSGIVTGVGEGTLNLTASIDGFLGINQSGNLNAYVTSTTGTFTNLNSQYFITNFKNLNANYSVTQSANLDASISGYLFSGALLANITPTGSFNNLNSYIIGNSQQSANLNVNVDGIIYNDLSALIESDKVRDLNAIIYDSSTSAKLLQGIYFTQSETFLSAGYSITNSKALNTIITAIESVPLYAKIKSNYSILQSSLYINTFNTKDLTAFINTNICATRNDYSNLNAAIIAQQANSLQARIVAIQNQYTIISNKIQILNNNSSLYQNKLQLNLIDPPIVFNKIKIDLVNIPILDLNAFIEGIPLHTDLLAKIKSLYYSNPKNQLSNSNSIDWINQLTGEKLTIRISFKTNNSVFYYSELANKVFTQSLNDNIVIVIECYDETEDDGTLLYARQKRSTCIVDNIQRFATIDDAIKFGIECATGTYGVNLNAFIQATGSYADLTTQIQAEETNFYDLNFKYNPVIYVPDLLASISGSGDFKNLNAYLTSNVTSSTILQASVSGHGLQNLLASISG